jgi:uncharacterized RDD family membrane protein YckC
MEPVSKSIRSFNFIIDLLVVRLGLQHYIVYPLLRIEYPILLAQSISGFRYGSYLVSLAVFFVYYFGMEATSGLTVGKLITRTKVLTIDGFTPTTYEIFIRTIWRLVPFEPVSWFGTQGWHDSQSKTTVVSIKDIENFRDDQ